MKYLNITYPDVNNGLGCRITLWLAGCNHHCKGCQNPETWNLNAGKEFNDDVKNKIYDILSKPYIKGITLSGGDPLLQYDEVLTLVKDIKSKFVNKDIWVYTGYTIDELKKDNKTEIFQYIDYLIDGKYVEELRDITLAFRGSANQIIYEKDENDNLVKSKLN